MSKKPTAAVSVTSNSDWLKKVDKAISDFAKEHRLVLRHTERELSAAFEVGCFHALLRFYQGQGYELKPENLQGGAYRYLTTPSGNPENFSYMAASGEDGSFQIRQQVRVRSHVDPDICFTPDLVVLVDGADIEGKQDPDFAGGKRTFFYVDSSSVVAAHECKSTNPFPELLIAFLGMLISAHAWHPNGKQVTFTNNIGHLAPTLFVGGVARALHARMILAMQKNYHINLVTGLHRGSWLLRDAKNRLTWSRSLSRRKRASNT